MGEGAMEAIQRMMLQLCPHDGSFVHVLGVQHDELALVGLAVKQLGDDPPIVLLFCHVLLSSLIAHRGNVLAGYEDRLSNYPEFLSGAPNLPALPLPVKLDDLLERDDLRRAIGCHQVRIAVSCVQCFWWGHHRRCVGLWLEKTPLGPAGKSHQLQGGRS